MPLLTPAHPRVPALIGVAATLVFIILLAIAGHTRSRAVAATGHSTGMMESADAAYSTLQDAESGQRGWLLTGNDLFLQPYTSGIDTLGQNLADLKTHAEAARDPHQVARSQKISALALIRLSDLCDGVRQANEKHRLFAVAQVREGDGRRVMEQLRLEVAELKAVESQKYGVNFRHSEGMNKCLLWTAAFGFVVQLFAFLLTLFMMQAQSQNETGRQTMALLQEGLDQVRNGQFSKMPPDLQNGLIFIDPEEPTDPVAPTEPDTTKASEPKPTNLKPWDRFNEV
jgi:CHASE3 domain sensor protein